ncbi:MAG: peptidoglycan bridge formation glycyltransferase FemA/FemB family protein [Candidatus Sungbacteria bacterium]|uniref:Peptidoglycan bridge formation glycyltransferase FemA/FemB family protein n=1 Tax=Candidatus Sungiibacteriota bacterium TaxID=2750080 RepID=A0A931WNK9_9BACT|nr:peptidoglycan bridge formation glycyltransferase FemA/FemB family protein [Candidatus Sungbacteria bacterium]
MNISQAEARAEWNQFVRQHCPPVGAFMQTWEWGTFQQSLGRKIDRYFLKDGNKQLAAFTLVHHSLPFGFSYGYIPRGPIIAAHAAGEDKLPEILNFIRTWAVRNFSRLIFLRLEPPLSSLAAVAQGRGFHFPSYYIQPRHNVIVSLDKEGDEIVKSFHPSTRSNIRRAENRGVTVEVKSRMTAADYRHFFVMEKETIQRNRGKNAYPSRNYFDALLRTIPPFSETRDPNSLSLGIFYGYQHNRPAAAHFVLFFCGTATYLYGASYSQHLNSKVTTYLHWIAMREAKQRGLRYYDLGGIDDARWPTLTNFKRQFRGQELTYIGNIDIPIRPVSYRIYNLLRRFRNT